MRISDWSSDVCSSDLLEIDHDMPAFGQATSHLEELVLGRVIDQALEEIEAYAANAAIMQLRQSVIRDRGIDNGHPARLAVRPGNRIQRRRIVVALEACLDDPVFREPPLGRALCREK